MLYINKRKYTNIKKDRSLIDNDNIKVKPPNPNKGSFDIIFPLLKKEKINSLKIRNALGSVIYSRSNLKKRTNRKRVQLNAKPGIYLVHLLTDKKLYKEKVIIK
ncbi:MAG: T9SS type A sorting domain-containing protein [Flavobacteriales bacterium]